VQFVVDSLRVQQLARELEAKSGDSLRVYWRAYWKKRTPKPAAPVATQPSDNIAEVDSSSVDTTAESDDSYFRESIVANETCTIALDSNRAVVRVLSPQVDSLTTETESLKKQRYLYGGLGFLLGVLIP